MNEMIVYVLLALVIGVVATVLLYRFLVIKNMKDYENHLRSEIKEKGDSLTALQKEKEFLNTEVATTKSDLQHAQKLLADKEDELEELNKKLTKEFENIANKVVNESSKVMQEKHEEKLKSLLTPFKDSIEKFEKKVERNQEVNIRQNESLKEQLAHLKELNKNIGDEAKNLTSALKGDKKLQGNWGENNLERILQAAGLKKETHYRREVNLKDDDDRNSRPDYIIYLPDEKNLIIDSKVSLIAYSDYFKAESDDEAKQAAKEHVSNVKKHISRLSDTNYAEKHGVNSPDYVIMYMPIDGALGMAMTEDTELFDFALKKNIVLVSNNSLLATLKTVAFIWRQDLQNKNALEIARQGGALYDKLAGFVNTLSSVGKRLDSAKADYEKAMGQLSTGSGNLVRRAENLKKLGIKTNKQIPIESDPEDEA